MAKRAVALAVVALFAQDTGTVPSKNVLSVRILFGVNDRNPRAWDGSVSVTGGDVVALRSWRPRAADKIEGTTSWKLAATPGMKFRYRNWEAEPPFPVPDYLNIPGLYLTVRSSGNALITIKTVNGEFSFRPADNSQTFLNGGVRVEPAATAASVSQPEYENGFADVVGERDGAFRVAWVGYKDWANRVFTRRFDGSQWNAIEELTGGPSDVYQVRLARDTQNRIWAVWANQVDGNFDLWGRHHNGKSWLPAQRLTSAPQPDIHPVLATGSDDAVWLAWQGFRDGQSDIFARRWDGSSWSPEERVSTSPGDDWNPALTTDSKGVVYIAWDTYDKGNYDVVMRRRNTQGWSHVIPVAATRRYEAYPSLACDSQDRVWVAWNESGTQWGKDTGFLVRRPATQLYQSRWISLAVYENSVWKQPTAPLEESLPEDLRGFNDFPRLAADGSGRIWVLFRHRFLRMREVPSLAAAHRAAWETYAAAFEGNRWLTPIPLPATQGRSDTGAGLARDAAGNLYAAWETDNRDYDQFLFRKGEILCARIPALSGTSSSPQLVARSTQADVDIFEGHPNEAKDLAKVRDYVIDSGGKKYRIYRGDTHRHTEYSGDGNNDGSLNDTYRYALNAAQLDYLGISDHHGDGGPNIEYINWLLQQRVDAFNVPGRFTPLYGYERGIGYPNGHRNVMFAKRGNPTLPTQPGEAEGKTGAKPLFEYLKKYGGISIPHTSATNMGTDWRDNDPEVEPLVEIYQGDRVSAEYEGAPKAATASDVTSQAGGFRPLGYVWNAWAKGYKLGVQASSDHLSTHISYACTIAEDSTKQGLLDAMKKRHNYGATDNIVLDYRMKNDGKEYLQGDIAPLTSSNFNLSIKVIGTAPIRQIDIIRNHEFVHTLQNQGADVAFTFADRDPKPGESYYYVRVQQVNDQIAWSTPIWVTVP